MPEVVNTSALTVENEAAEAEDNRPVMIDVDHVSMSFNMASEQLNNLKEYAIAIARGKLYFEEFKALDDVSFKVRKGDVFGIMGTNGSGKSTVLKIIAGVLEPSKGKCTVNGNIAPLIELGAGFDMDLSARENIYLNGALLGYSKQFIDEHFQEIVEFAEVEKFLDMPLKNYSSGMVARIAFAIATVIVPEILVVDEVLSVGDFMFQKKCEDRITQLIEEYGVTVLIVSHSNDQIARLCNKAVWIEKGHVRLQGDAKTVARVYDVIGGRVGSKESEEHILDILKKSSDFELNKNNHVRFGGNNPSSVNSHMVLDASSERSCKDLILVSNSSHANAIVAAAFGGALNAPIVPIGTDSISDSIEHVLFSLTPSNIYVFDCDGHSEQLYNQLEMLPWSPSIKTFGDKLNLFELSQSVYEYGLTNKLWGNRISLICFADNCEAISAAPYLYAKNCPVLMLHDEESRIDKIESFLKSNPNVDICNAFGEHAANLIDALKTTKQVDASRLPTKQYKDCLSIANFVKSEIANDKGLICIASQSLAQWQELLSSGFYVATKGVALLLLDQTSLDSFASCLNFISDKAHDASGIAFIGGKSGLSSIEMSIFTYEYCEARNRR